LTLTTVCVTPRCRKEYCLILALHAYWKNATQRFRHIEGILRVLGPDATLRRGYSITTNEHGQIIRTTAAVRAKMRIRTRVNDGEFGSRVL
jgi:exodeoxyribonuclease VII large subunit